MNKHLLIFCCMIMHMVSFADEIQSIQPGQTFTAPLDKGIHWIFTDSQATKALAARDSLQIYKQQGTLLGVKADSLNTIIGLKNDENVKLKSAVDKFQNDWNTCNESFRNERKSKVKLKKAFLIGAPVSALVSALFTSAIMIKILK